MEAGVERLDDTEAVRKQDLNIAQNHKLSVEGPLRCNSERHQWKWQRWRCVDEHAETIRDHVRNYIIRQRLKVENTTEVQASKTQVVWTCKDARPRIRRNKDEMVPPGRRRRGRPKQRWVDCVNRDVRAIGTTEDEVHDRTSWMRIVYAAVTQQPSGSG